jgi:hypothetical protein
VTMRATVSANENAHTVIVHRACADDMEHDGWESVIEAAQVAHQRDDSLSRPRTLRAFAGSDARSSVASSSRARRRLSAQLLLAGWAVSLSHGSDSASERSPEGLFGCDALGIGCSVVARFRREPEHDGFCAS